MDNRGRRVGQGGTVLGAVTALANTAACFTVDVELL